MVKGGVSRSLGRFRAFAVWLNGVLARVKLFRTIFGIGRFVSLVGLWPACRLRC